MEPSYPGLKAAFEKAEIKVGKRRAPPTKEELASAAVLPRRRGEAAQDRAQGRRGQGRGRPERGSRHTIRPTGRPSPSCATSRPCRARRRARAGARRPGDTRSGDALLRREPVQSGPGPAVAAALGPGQEDERRPQARQRLEDTGVLMARTKTLRKNDLALAAALALVLVAPPSVGGILGSSAWPSRRAGSPASSRPRRAPS